MDGDGEPLIGRTQSLRGMWQRVFWLRSLLIVLVAVVSLAVDHADARWLAAAAIGVALPYNVVLQRLSRRAECPPAFMPYGDQVVCAAFAVFFPFVLPAAMVAATFGLAIASLAFTRNIVIGAAVVGTVAVAAALPLWQMFGQGHTPGAELGVAAYAVAAPTMAAVIATIASRERETSRWLGDLLDGLEAAVWEYDPTTQRVTYVNPTIESLLGYPCEQWLAEERFRERVVHPDDRERAERAIATVGHAGGPVDHTLRVLHADGSVRWVRELITADHNNASDRVRGTTVDVTESETAKRRQIARTRQQSALVEIGQWALRESDITRLSEGVAASVSPVLGIDVCHVLRYDEDQRHLVLVGAAGFRTPVAVGAVVDAGATSQGGFTMRSSAPVVVEDLATEQRFTPMSVLLDEGVTSGMSVVIEGPDGRPFGALGVHSRVHRTFTTDEVLFLQSVANTIATVVARWTVEGQLLQAQKMEAVGQLAGGMAHDFNNLLTAILGYAELLAPDVAGMRRAEESLLELRDAGRSAASLVEQLLTFSRGKVIERGPVELNEVVTATQKLLGRLLGDDIVVQTDLAPVGSVESTPLQMEQLIVNLAVNARDAMPLGGVFLISTAPVALDAAASRSHDLQPGTYVKLACSDTGTGMDELTRQRVFEPFFTTKTEGKGTGLGLATVYAIVRNAGGRVWVDSAPGQGTTVSALLPLTAKAVARPDAPATVDGPTTGSETIMLVEDQATVRALLRTVLEQHGYRVIEATDGHEALALFAENPAIELLVTDVVMPQLSGPDLVELLADKAPALRVLYVSGFAARSSLPRAGGATDFLHKPFGIAEFMTKVRTLLDGPSIGQAIA